MSEYTNFRDGKLESECEYFDPKDWRNSLGKLEDKKYHKKLG